MIYEDRGIDNNKKVNGRKHQLLVDIRGRLWRIIIHAANGHDGPRGIPLSEDMEALDMLLDKILGDVAYVDIFAKKTAENGLDYEKTSRPKSSRWFAPIEKNWMVERTIAWTNLFRRVVKEHEYTVEFSATWMILANMTIMLQRIPAQAK